MRILLDESLPVELASEIGLPDVKTVSQVGLKGLKNGDLLRRAESMGFAILITADQSMEFQQDLAGYTLGFIVLRARSNRMDHLRALMPAVRQSLQLLSPGQVMRIGV